MMKVKDLLKSLQIYSEKYIKYIFGIFILLILCIVGSLFFTQRTVYIKGNTYLIDSVIEEVFPDKKISLWEIDKEQVIKDLQMNPFIQDASINIELFNKLNIDLKLVKLVGKTFFNGENQFISEKGDIISGEFVKSSFFLPIISTSPEKSIKSLNLPFVSQQLAIFKKSYPEFFLKIQKIHLLDDKNVSIFIVYDEFGSLKEYRLHHLPSVQDWIKIQILDSKYQQGSVISIDGDSVIVQN